jgi:transposase
MSVMAKAYPSEFKRDVVAVARRREAKFSQIAKDFGISQGTLHAWVKQADQDDGAASAGKPVTDTAELREARKRIRLLEQENEILRRATAYLAQATLPK